MRVHELFTTEQKTEILNACFEGGSNYWIDGAVKILHLPFKKAEEKEEEGLYASQIAVMDGGKIEIVEDEDKTKHTLRLPDFNKGIELCAQRYPKTFSRLREEQYDAGDADVVLQLAIFGELIYG